MVNCDNFIADVTTIPFTYLIGWSDYQKYYYGVKFAKGCHPKQLWNSYFTSSKEVKRFRKDYGEPDIIEVRKVFDSSDKSRAWEEKVIRRLKMVLSENWFNKGNAGKEFYLKEHSPKAKEKMSKRSIENNIKRLNEGNHNFLDSQFQKDVNKKRLENRITSIFK